MVEAEEALSCSSQRSIKETMISSFRYMLHQLSFRRPLSRRQMHPVVLKALVGKRIVP
jgi:hypothetical protein